jgi:phage shock protein A
MTFLEFVRATLLKWFAPSPPADPKEQLRALMERLQGELRDAKIQAADMIRQQNALESERDDCLLAVDRANASALAAVEDRNEQRARRYVEQKLQSQQIADQLDEQLNALRSQVQALRDAIETYKLEIERVEHEQRTWEVRERTARMKSTLEGEFASEAVSEARALIRASRDAALMEEARVEVRQHVRQSQPAATARQLAANRAVEEELQRLKSQVRAGGAKDS